MVIFSMRVDVTVTIVTSSFPRQPRCYNWLPSPKSPKAESTIIPTYRTRVNPSQGVRILICSKTSLWIGKFTKKCSTLDVHFSMDLLNRPYYQRTLGRAYLLYQRSKNITDFIQRMTAHGVLAAFF